MRRKKRGGRERKSKRDMQVLPGGALMKGATPKQLPHAKVVQQNRPLAGVIQPSRGAPQHRRDVEGEFNLIEFSLISLNLDANKFELL